MIELELTQNTELTFNQHLLYYKQIPRQENKCIFSVDHVIFEHRSHDQSEQRQLSTTD